VRAAALVFVVFALFAALAGACGDPAAHLFSARLYDAQRGCLGAAAQAIDVISGGGSGGACAPVCLVAPGDDGGSAVYVSTDCPPYPHGAAVEDADAAADPADPCAGALAAFNAGTTCTDAGAADASPEQ
jgi:hypothetical protein